MNLSRLELFQHELCIDFQHEHEMSKAEAQQFHEAFSHFHHAMTGINGQTLLNQVWLQEHFFDLWNENTPQMMFQKVIEHAVEMIALNQKPDVINKENKGK